MLLVPSAVGQLMEAVTSGRYDTDHLALADVQRDLAHRQHLTRAGQ